MPPNGRGVGHGPVGVDPDGAGVQPVGDPMCAVDVVRPDARGQPVRGVVRDRDRLLLVAERQHREDGPKISSRATSISLWTPVRIVGCMNSAAERRVRPAAEGDRRALGDGALDEAR